MNRSIYITPLFLSLALASCATDADDLTYVEITGELSSVAGNEYPNVMAGFLAGDRIGVLAKDGHLYVKQGPLGAEWTDETPDFKITQAVLHGDRIGVLRSDGVFRVKDGGLSAGWVDEHANVKKGFLAGDRIGVLLDNGEFKVKDGGLSETWTTENPDFGVLDAALTSGRIGVLRDDGHFLVKEGLHDEWTDEDYGVTLGILDGHRIGVLRNDGKFKVKDGELGETWTTQNPDFGVTSGVLSDP